MNTRCEAYLDSLVKCSLYSITDIPGVCFSLSNSVANLSLSLTRRNLIMKTSMNSAHVKGGSSDAFLPSRSVLYHCWAGPCNLCVANSTALPLRHLRVLRASLVWSMNSYGLSVRGFPMKVRGFNLRKESMVTFVPVWGWRCPLIGGSGSA